MFQSRLRYITDGKRHLICLPYSVANLHQMARELDIDRCWYHYKSKKTGRIRPHYDIPKGRRAEIERRCVFVRYCDIVNAIKAYYNEI